MDYQRQVITRSVGPEIGHRNPAKEDT